MNEVYRVKPANDALAVTNLILGLLILTVGGTSLYFGFAYRPELDPEDARPYAAVARERLERHADEIAAEAAAVAAEVGPPITNAVLEQVKEDYPRYARTLKSEGKEYLVHVEAAFLREVKARYADYLRQHRKIIKEEFPEHAADENVEKIVADFEQTFNRLVERYYLDEFRREAERTVTLWEKVRPVATPSADQPSLNEQLADLTTDWAVLALSDEAEERLTSGGNPDTAQTESPQATKEE